MNSFFKSIRTFAQRLSPGQQLALLAVLVGGIGLLIGVAYWAGKPDYALLFGRLESSDASKIVESLRDKRVPYRLRENGTAIYVPRDQVYELRLQYAGEGLVSDGIAGYELFDRNTLGMTDFMQKLNLKRALEGELARTISNIRQVEICRVHLVLPERSPFRESQTEPSASVVLQLRSGAQLTPAQIEGITALVAGAVEGLNAANVTILDTRGNMLSNPEAGNAEIALSNTQIRMQRAIEANLVEKGQSMLDQVLGTGNALVRVSATLDLTRSIAEREIIDPESATVISEERLNEAGNGANATSMVRNFDLSRTRERAERNIGAISYLTVSVIVNYKRVPAGMEPGAQAADYVAYTPEELQEIEALVKNAVGFNPDRTDRFAIHQTKFDTSVDDQVAAHLLQQQKQEQLQMYLRYALMLLGIGLAFWLLRSVSQSLTAGPESKPDSLLRAELMQQRPVAQGPAYAQLPASDGDELHLLDDAYTQKLSPEAKARLKAKHQAFEQLKKNVNENPQAAVDLIRTWLVEDAAPAGTF